MFNMFKKPVKRPQKVVLTRPQPDFKEPVAPTGNIENDISKLINPDLSSSASIITDKENILSTGAMISMTKTGDKVASVILSIDNNDEDIDVTVFDKNDNVIATKNDIGFIGVSGINNKADNLIDLIDRTNTTLKYNNDRINFEYEHKDLAKGYWLNKF